MEQVESAAPYRFDGQQDIALVPFNRPQSLPLYRLILSSKAKDASSTLSKLILGQYPELEALSAGGSAKQVCAKIVSRGETIVECLNCRMDESCIICLPCFKNGNHEGHKVLYKKAYGGCCDCGDAEAWNPQGFCRDHSGQLQDVPIDPADTATFEAIFQDLFYIYFRIKLRKEGAQAESATLLSLVAVCEHLADVGPRGIKLLAGFLRSALPERLRLSSGVQGSAVLDSMFTWELVSRDLRLWEQLFIKMFPYYEFKKMLLATYVRRFPQLYAAEQACGIGQSLACQILTSYKLVEDYIDANGDPLGYNLTPVAPEYTSYHSSMLCADIEKILKLQDPVPEKYARLLASKGIHILFSSQDGLDAMVAKAKQAVELINKKQEKKKKKKKKKKNADEAEHQEKEEEEAFFNPILFMMSNIRQIFNEYTSLTLLVPLLRVISNDRASLKRMLRDLTLLIDTTSEELVIFRPYDRAWALTLFALCGQELEKLREVEMRHELMELLGKGEQDFVEWVRRVEGRMLQTYFFYPHILSNQDRGYHSSFFNYIYLYRSKDNLLVSIDTLHLKMLALLTPVPQPLNFTRLMRFQDFDEEKWTPFILTNMLQELQLLYIGHFPEIYITHYDLTSKEISSLQVKPEVFHYLAKFLVGEGNSASLERAAQFSKSFLFANNDLLKKCLAHCSNYSKERKVFELKEEYRLEKPFNYKDFDLRLNDTRFANATPDQSRPQLTHILINGYNSLVFSRYWNDQNIETIKQAMLGLYEEAVASQIHDSIVTVATLICNFCSNLRAFGSPDQQPVVDEMLLRTAFSPEVKLKLAHFATLIGREEGQGDSKLKEKKDLLMLKKMKKMEELKRKQEENMLTIREVHKIEEEAEDKGEFCAICRSKESPKGQLVYLVELNVRNLEKLASLGEGVQTASFTTCYHIFDYACIQKECKHDYEAGLRCPVCRRPGNIFFPAFPLAENSHPYLQACIERITQVMMTIHSYREIDPLEELFKSFFHLVLLWQFGPQYVRKSRLKLYGVILEMLSHREVQGLLPTLVAAFASSELRLNPRLLKKDKLGIIDLKGGVGELLEDSDSEFEDESESLIMVEIPTKSASNKKPEVKSKPKKANIPPAFRHAGIRIFKHILEAHQEGERIQDEKMKEIIDSQILPEVPKGIELAVSELLEGEEGKEQQAQAELRLMALPANFEWDMSRNECDICHEPCHDLFVCLLCPWKGCVNCKPGGVGKHYPQAHGEASAFMRVRDGAAYVIGNKMIKKMGQLYVNEWGETLNLAREWSSFTLQQDVLERTRNLLLRDE